MELLLLSNSRTAAGFLVDYAPEIKDFAGSARHALFVPYAVVQRTWEEFAEMVREALPGFTVEILERPTLSSFYVKQEPGKPIVDPGGLEALGLLPFQLNCHYTNHAIPGHHGETRDQRLAELAHVNPDLPVLALPEGDWLQRERIGFPRHPMPPYA